jgi:micrococcal nuclease
VTPVTLRPSAPAQNERMQSFRAITTICTLALLLGTACASPAEPRQPVLTGKVIKVIDADTIDVQLTSGPIRVRFHGIDAPEHDQPWGNEAAAALRKRIAGKEVDVEPFQQDRYDRLIGIVYLGDVDINAELVQNGNAWAYRSYMRKADGTLCADEAAARIRKSGLWSQSKKDQVTPWEWRKRKKLEHFTDYSNETTQRCIAAIGAH